ncbi:neutral zinc metallopeptidase [Herbidospora cretacea]|uniref:neutral zinc metallopeptidase n=1 Tax=Herbidospora cretacea TaxID=28444 RepID=UPI000AF788BC|nr:neutral zinc metallopeptidase [Herbidospora cretacea]
MRLTPFVTALVLLLVMGAAPASAYPIDNRVLSHNALYRTGQLALADCPEPPLRDGDAASARRYATAVTNCLNEAWGTHFRRNGLPFVPVKISFQARPKAFCGRKWGDAAGRYCDGERRFMLLLDKGALADSSNLYLYLVIAHEFGHHLQNLTGMSEAYRTHPYHSKAELYQQIRRNELQAECLAGVFFGAVWPSLGRSDADWQYLRELDGTGHSRTHGRGKNVLRWLDGGFATRKPGTCNTWTARSAKVA